MLRGAKRTVWATAQLLQAWHYHRFAFQHRLVADAGYLGGRLFGQAEQQRFFHAGTIMNSVCVGPGHSTVTR